MKRLSTFIVDDDDIYQFTATRQLQLTEKVDHIKTFLNGKLAIEYLIEHAENAEMLPDIIFLDINMPIMNGWGFLEEFQVLKDKLAKSIMVFMVSSSINHMDRKMASENGNVTSFLTKPINAEVFNNLLSELVAN
ncbi:MAG: response regulator [Bacteroidetes bacterium]|nr:response regulator [Bacteroidota bacterium]